jgi:hypothetical protein
MIFHFMKARFSLGGMGEELYFRGGEIDYAIQSQLCD